MTLIPASTDVLLAPFLFTAISFSIFLMCCGIFLCTRNVDKRHLHPDFDWRSHHRAASAAAHAHQHHHANSSNCASSNLHRESYRHAIDNSVDSSNLVAAEASGCRGETNCGECRVVMDYAMVQAGDHSDCPRTHGAVRQMVEDPRNREAYQAMTYSVAQRDNRTSGHSTSNSGKCRAAVVHSADPWQYAMPPHQHWHIPISAPLNGTIPTRACLCHHSAIVGASAHPLTNGRVVVEQRRRRRRLTGPRRSRSIVEYIRAMWRNAKVEDAPAKRNRSVKLNEEEEEDEEDEEEEYEEPEILL